MPMADWIHKYPQVQALLQDAADVLDYLPDMTAAVRDLVVDEAMVADDVTPTQLEMLRQLRRNLYPDDESRLVYQCLYDEVGHQVSITAVPGVWPGTAPYRKPWPELNGA